MELPIAQEMVSRVVNGSVTSCVVLETTGTTVAPVMVVLVPLESSEVDVQG